MVSTTISLFYFKRQFINLSSFKFKQDFKSIIF